MDYKKAAELELGWWMAHHDKKYEGADGVIDLMAKEYVVLFDMPYEVAKDCIMHRIFAGKEHDLAEKEGINKEEADVHWAKALERLEEHFKSLDDFLSSKKQD